MMKLFRVSLFRKRNCAAPTPPSGKCASSPLCSCNCKDATSASAIESERLLTLDERNMNGRRTSKPESVPQPSASAQKSNLWGLPWWVPSSCDGRSVSWADCLPWPAQSRECLLSLNTACFSERPNSPLLHYLQGLFWNVITEQSLNLSLPFQLGN